GSGNFRQRARDFAGGQGTIVLAAFFDERARDGTRAGDCEPDRGGAQRNDSSGRQRADGDAVSDSFSGGGTGDAGGAGRSGGELGGRPEHTGCRIAGAYKLSFGTNSEHAGVNFNCG